MAQPAKCQKVCDTDITGEQAKFINNRVRENYAINWLIDGLPVGHERDAPPGVGGADQGQKLYSIGFPLGSDAKAQTPKLHNHYEIKIDFHHNQLKDKRRVVGITVEPYRYG